MPSNGLCAFKRCGSAPTLKLSRKVPVDAMSVQGVRAPKTGGHLSKYSKTRLRIAKGQGLYGVGVRNIGQRIATYPVWRLG